MRAVLNLAVALLLAACASATIAQRHSKNHAADVPPSTTSAPTAYTWRTDNIFIDDDAQFTPLVVGKRVIVPSGGVNTAGVAALDTATGAVLWNYTVPLTGDPRIPHEGNLRHVYLNTEFAFVAVDSDTGRMVWMLENVWAETITARDDVLILTSANNAFVVNVTNGQQLSMLTLTGLTTWSEAMAVFAYGGHATLFTAMTAPGQPGFSVSRIDLLTNNFVWNVTIANADGSLANAQEMQVNWDRRELFIIANNSISTLDMGTGAVKAIIYKSPTSWARAARDGVEIVALSDASNTWSSVCAMNTSTLECIWETFNATCSYPGSSSAGMWRGAASLATAGSDVVVAIGYTGGCLHGYSAADGSIMWTHNGTMSDTWMLPLADFKGTVNHTAITAVDNNPTTGITIVALNPRTGSVMNTINNFTSFETYPTSALTVTDDGMVIVAATNHVYGIQLFR
jgi:hypothetical protein